MNKLHCDGSCEVHGEQVFKVSVAMWGEFNYCQEAIDEDRRRGLVVTFIDDKDVGEPE